MHGLVLAAGRESQLDSALPELPPLFLDICGKSLYEWQLDTLARICDEITVVLGYGFVGSDDRVTGRQTVRGTFDGEIRVRQEGLRDPLPAVREDKLRAYLSTDHSVDLTAIVVPHWDDAGPAESCRIGLEETSDDVLIVHGNLVYRDYVLRTIAAEFETRLASEGLSIISVKPGFDEGPHRVGWDMEGRITTYGDIPGLLVADVFIVHERHIERAQKILASHREQDVPVAYPSIASTFVPLPPESLHVIQTPAQFAEATAAVTEWSRGFTRHESSFQ